MSQLDNTKLYIQQWVETATKGKVEIEWAWFVKRMLLSCTICKETLTAPIPSDANTIDFSVSQFVQVHSHTGWHNDGCRCATCITKPIPVTKESCTHATKGGTSALIKHTLPNNDVLTLCQRCGETWTTKLVPLTADFKKLSWGDQKNPDKDAAKLAEQLKKFKEEYANKDVENIEKIKALQAEALNAKQKLALEDLKVKNEVNLELLKMKAKFSPEYNEVYSKEQVQLLKNAQKLKEFQAFEDLLKSPIGAQIFKNAGLSGYITRTAPETKKAPVKKDIRGRKFR